MTLRSLSLLSASLLALASPSLAVLGQVPEDPAPSQRGPAPPPATTSPPVAPGDIAPPPLPPLYTLSCAGSAGTTTAALEVAGVERLPAASPARSGEDPSGTWVRYRVRGRVRTSGERPTTPAAPGAAAGVLGVGVWRAVEGAPRGVEVMVEHVHAAPAADGTFAAELRLERSVRRVRVEVQAWLEGCDRSSLRATRELDLPTASASPDRRATD